MTQQRSRGIQKKSRIVHVFQNCMQNRFHKIAKRTYLLFFSNSLLLICRLELIINYTQDTCTYIYYTCKRQGTTVSKTIQNILGMFSNKVWHAQVQITENKQQCRSDATIYITTSRMLHEKKRQYSWTPYKIYSFCEPQFAVLLYDHT